MSMLGTEYCTPRRNANWVLQQPKFKDWNRHFDVDALIYAHDSVCWTALCIMSKKSTLKMSTNSSSSKCVHIRYVETIDDHYETDCAAWQTNQRQASDKCKNNAEFNYWTSCSTCRQLKIPSLDLPCAAKVARFCHNMLLKRHVQHTHSRLLPLTCNHNNDKLRLGHWVSYPVSKLWSHISRPAFIHCPASIHCPALYTALLLY